MRHINTRLIVEQARDDELRKLQGLYFSDNAAFVKLVKPHIRFAWHTPDSKHGQYKYPHNPDTEFGITYHLIWANHNDVMNKTTPEQRIKSLTVSNNNHISVGHDIKSRIFSVAYHALTVVG